MRGTSSWRSPTTIAISATVCCGKAGSQARGLGSGVPVTAPLDILYDLRDGKISRMHSFLDHGEALRAAGLEE